MEFNIHELLQKCITIVDKLSVVAERINKGKIKAQEGNALVNAYRSSATISLEVIRAIEGSKYITSKGDRTEFTDEDRARLDNIVKLLSKGKRSVKVKEWRLRNN